MSSEHLPPTLQDADPGSPNDGANMGSMDPWRLGGSRVSTTIVEAKSCPTNLLFNENYAIISLESGHIHAVNKKTMAKGSLMEHGTGVWALDVLGDTAISGGIDCNLRVWDLETGNCRHVLTGHTSTVRTVKMLDDSIAISGSRDSTLRIWDTETGACKNVLTGHTKTVRCVEVAGDIAVSGSYDCTARVWSISKAQCLQTLTGHRSQLYCVAFDGKRVITGGLDTDIRIWNPVTGECIAIFQGHTSLIGNLRILGDVLVSSDSVGCIRVWSVEELKPIHRIGAHDNSIISLKVDRDRIMSGSSDGSVKIWDFRTGHVVRELLGDAELVWHVGLEPAKCYVLAYEKGNLVLSSWDFS